MPTTHPPWLPGRLPLPLMPLPRLLRLEAGDFAGDTEEEEEEEVLALALAMAALR